MQASRYVLLPLALLLCSTSAFAADIAITPTPEHGEKASETDISSALELTTETTGLTAYAFTTNWENVKGPDAADIQSFLLSTQAGVSARLPAIFNLYLIDTSARTLPSEIRKSKWGTQSMLLQFDTMLSNLATKLGSDVKWVSLANNADIYFTERPNELEDFLKFYKQAAGSAQRRFPNARIGLTVSHEGLMGARKEIAEQLIAASDAIFVTYSPFDDKKVKDTAVLDQDLKDLVASATGKSLVLQGFGYPSDRTAGGSDKAQTEFLETYLPQLKAAPQVSAVSLFGLHDLDKGSCKSFLANAKIKERGLSAGYCSMGLIETNGKKKPAWKDLTKLLKAVPPAASPETAPDTAPAPTTTP